MFTAICMAIFVADSYKARVDYHVVELLTSEDFSTQWTKPKAIHSLGGMTVVSAAASTGGMSTWRFTPQGEKVLVAKIEYIQGKLLQASGLHDDNAVVQIFYTSVTLQEYEHLLSGIAMIDAAVIGPRGGVFNTSAVSYFSTTIVFNDKVLLDVDWGGHYTSRTAPRFAKPYAMWVLIETMLGADSRYRRDEITVLDRKSCDRYFSIITKSLKRYSDAPWMIAYQIDLIGHVGTEASLLCLKEILNQNESLPSVYFATCATSKFVKDKFLTKPVDKKDIEANRIKALAAIQKAP